MPMASLSASLLARKGHARPATQPGTVAAAEKKVQEMFPAKRPQLASPYASKPAALVVAKAVQAPAQAPAKTAAKAAGSASARARKTLRLDRAKNRQLRLLAAHLGVTQQALMEEAVSKLLKQEIAAGSCICGVCIDCSSKKPQ